MAALYPSVMSIIRGRLPRRMAEEDLAQEVFVRFFEKLGSYDGRAPRSTAVEVWARLALRAVPLGTAVLLVCWMALPAQPVENIARELTPEQRK